MNNLQTPVCEPSLLNAEMKLIIFKVFFFILLGTCFSII